MMPLAGGEDAFDSESEYHEAHHPCSHAMHIVCNAILVRGL